MGLDIFPTSSTQPVPPASSSNSTSLISTRTGQAFGKEGARSGTASNKGPVPKQQGESDFREMLENFVSSFDQEIHSSNAAAGETVGRSQTRSRAGSSQAAKQQEAGTTTSLRSRPRKANNRKKSVPKHPPKRGRKKEHMLPQQRQEELVPPSEPIIRKLHKQEKQRLLQLQQLKQMPVVKLVRRDSLPDTMVLSGKGLWDLSSNKVPYISAFLLSS